MSLPLRDMGIDCWIARQQGACLAPGMWCRTMAEGQEEVDNAVLHTKQFATVHHSWKPAMTKLADKTTHSFFTPIHPFPIFDRALLLTTYQLTLQLHTHHAVLCRCKAWT